MKYISDVTRFWLVKLWWHNGICFLLGLISHLTRFSSCLHAVARWADNNYCRSYFRHNLAKCVYGAYCSQYLLITKVDKQISTDLFIYLYNVGQSCEYVKYKQRPPNLFCDIGSSAVYCSTYVTTENVKIIECLFDQTMLLFPFSLILFQEEIYFSILSFTKVYSRYKINISRWI